MASIIRLGCGRPFRSSFASAAGADQGGRSAQQVEERPCDDLGRAAQVGEVEVLVGALGVASRGRCAARRRRSPLRRRPPRRGARRCRAAFPRRRSSRRRPLRRCAAALRPAARGRAAGRHAWASSSRSTSTTMPGARRRAFVDHLAHFGFDRDRVFLGDHAPVEAQDDLPRDDVGVAPAFDPADVEVRMRDARPPPT